MDVSARTVISRPVADVFEYVMEVPHDAEWRNGVVEAAFTSEGPLGVGTTGFDRIEANGREMVASWTVFEYEPGALARWTIDTGPIKGTGGYICAQDEAGTSFTLEGKVRPTGWFRMLGPIFGMVGRRQNQADVEKLKAILEDRSKGEFHGT